MFEIGWVINGLMAQ